MLSRGWKRGVRAKRKSGDDIVVVTVVVKYF
jgi:hypothetical protein